MKARGVSTDTITSLVKNELVIAHEDRLVLPRIAALADQERQELHGHSRCRTAISASQVRISRLHGGRDLSR
jgi:hypothetical protein